MVDDIVSNPKYFEIALDDLCKVVASLNDTWWKNPATGEPTKRNVGEMLMLVTSELAEALEGDRKNLQDDKLPQYKMYDVEIIDALIRLFDIAGHHIPKAGEIFVEKLKYNAQRADHKPENRIKDGGKRY